MWISRSFRIVETTVKTQDPPKERTNNTGMSSLKKPKNTDAALAPQYATLEESPDAERGIQENEVERENPANEDFHTPPQVPQRRVSTRNNKNGPPLRLTYKVTAHQVIEPKSLAEMETTSTREWKLWRLAAEEEMKSLTDHSVWELADLPAGRSLLTCKSVFKTDGDGKLDTYKARLVARGFSQKYGEDYDETLLLL